MGCPALRLVDVGSFMTGRRPDTTNVWESDDHFREAELGTANGMSWQSLPQYFNSAATSFSAGAHRLHDRLGAWHAGLRGHRLIHTPMGPRVCACICRCTRSGKLLHPKSPLDNDCPGSPECIGGPGGPCPSSSARGSPDGPYSCLDQDPPATSGSLGGLAGSKGSFCVSRRMAAAFSPSRVNNATFRLKFIVSKRRCARCNVLAGRERLYG